MAGPSANPRSADWPNLLSAYAIQVRWSREPIEADTIRSLKLTENVRAYTVRAAVGGHHAYGLRIGFFPSEREALLMIERLDLVRAGVIPVYEPEMASVVRSNKPPASAPPAAQERRAAPRAPATAAAATQATLPPAKVNGLLASHAVAPARPAPAPPTTAPAKREPTAAAKHAEAAAVTARPAAPVARADVPVRDDAVKARPATSSRTIAPVRTAPAAAAGQRKNMSRTDWVLYTVLATALTIGWQLRGEQYLVAEAGLGYALGIMGGTSMLVLFLYPVRKRIRARYLGSVRSWFRVHTMLGVIGPSLILFHSNFGTGSLNDNVALWSMLLVAGSGLFGRYFYAKIHYGLYGRKATLSDLRKDASEARSQHSAIDLVSKLNARLLEVEDRVLKAPETLLQSAVRPIKLAVKTRVDYFILRRFARQEIALQAQSSPLVAANLSELQKVAANHIADRLDKIRKVAEFSFYDRLFAAWHIFHYPLFFLLVIAAVIHVIAVHFY